MRFVACLIALVLFSTAFAQQPLPNTGSASGEVRCQDGNTPARKAGVSLVPLASLVADPALPASATSPAFYQANTETDFQGAFFFPSLAPGTYLINADLPGYSNTLELLRTVLGQVSPAQRRKLLSTFPSLTVTPGAEAHGTLVLTRGGSIDGSVFVDTGGLVGPNFVTATLVASSLLGSLDLTDAAAAYIRQSPLDDLGRFHIAGLPPGRYLLSIGLVESYSPLLFSHHTLHSPRRGRNGTANLTVYFPSALSRSRAEPVLLRDGEHLTGKDIPIPMSTLHSIHGTLLEGGNPRSHAAVAIRPSLRTPGDPAVTAIPDAISDANGAFTFDLVPSGAYLISARRFVQSGPVLSSQPEIEVPVTLGDTDIPDLLVSLPATPQ